MSLTPTASPIAVLTLDITEEIRVRSSVEDAFAALYLRYRTVANPVGYLRVSVLNGGRRVLRRRRQSPGRLVDRTVWPLLATRSSLLVAQRQSTASTVLALTLRTLAW